MESYKYDLFGGRTLHVALYTNVQNSSALLQLVQDQAVDAALINARLIVDVFQIHTAAGRALLCDQHGTLTTKTIHGELVFNLSGTRNVAESFRRFGVSAGADAILLCVFDATEERLAALSKLVLGSLVPVDQLGSYLATSDLTLIKKYYKIQDLELKSSTLVDAIASRIATKSCSK